MPSAKWWTEPTRWMLFRSRSRSTCPRRKSLGSPAPKAPTGWRTSCGSARAAFMYFWRSCLDPIWNHYIRGPVRIWSVDDGPDEQALTALEARDFESLKRLIPEPADERLHLRADLGAALAHLREVRDKYWIIAGGAGTVAPAATRRTNCGMRSRAISTCLMPPGLAIRTPEVSVCSLSLGTRSTGPPKSFPGPPAERIFGMFTQLNDYIPVQPYAVLQTITTQVTVGQTVSCQACGSVFRQQLEPLPFGEM